MSYAPLTCGTIPAVMPSFYPLCKLLASQNAPHHASPTGARRWPLSQPDRVCPALGQPSRLVEAPDLATPSSCTRAPSRPRELQHLSEHAAAARSRAPRVSATLPKCSPTRHSALQRPLLCKQSFYRDVFRLSKNALSPFSTPFMPFLPQIPDPFVCHLLTSLTCLTFFSCVCASCPLHN